MPVYQFEAMDAKGQEVRDVLEAKDQDEAQATIRQKGYFITKISVKKNRKGAAEKAPGQKKGKTFAMGGVSSKKLTTFTRQLAILQDAGLPILRSLKILEQQSKPGALKNSLIDVCDEIESGSTLSEAMGKSPKAFDRLYVNMIKAGEAGGALETILKRLAEFQERSQSLKRKVKGAMIYPIFVVGFAVGILIFIMLVIVPQFEKIFKDFGTKLPGITTTLIDASKAVATYWYLIPIIPIAFWLFLKMLRKFAPGRAGWDFFTIRVPIFGQIVEKNIVARTTRTLGTLISSGVPILESLHITRETAGNVAFESMYGRVYDAIREGESIAKPLKEHSFPLKNPSAPLGLGFLAIMVLPLGGVFGFALYKFGVSITASPMDIGILALVFTGVLVGYLFMRLKAPVLDDMVINMVDVGEETGELDTMLYKVADNYDEEVSVLTESLTKLMEPLLIITLGGIVGFIVIALFMPLISLITSLSSGGK